MIYIVLKEETIFKRIRLIWTMTYELLIVIFIWAFPIKRSHVLDHVSILYVTFVVFSFTLSVRTSFSINRLGIYPSGTTNIVLIGFFHIILCCCYFAFHFKPWNKLGNTPNMIGMLNSNSALKKKRLLHKHFCRVLEKPLRQLNKQTTLNNYLATSYSAKVVWHTRQIETITTRYF